MTAANEVEDRVRAILDHRQPVPTSAGQILEALAAVPDNEGLTAAEVAQAIGLSKVRVHALLRQMASGSAIVIDSTVRAENNCRARVW
ncbi:helix-turn-helix domain-containing protein, partial [Escherichia coli]|uniref:helix-turn-helix domain-containing protein n=1 Tax=Escherichia coli TaxID=562 RepID=UPI00159BDABB